MSATTEWLRDHDRETRTRERNAYVARIAKLEERLSEANEEIGRLREENRWLRGKR